MLKSSLIQLQEHLEVGKAWLLLLLAEPHSPADLDLALACPLAMLGHHPLLSSQVHDRSSMGQTLLNSGLLRFALFMTGNLASLGLAAAHSCHHLLRSNRLARDNDCAFSAAGAQSSNPFGSTQKAFGNTAGFAFGQQTGESVRNSLKFIWLLIKPCGYASEILPRLQT